MDWFETLRDKAEDIAGDITGRLRYGVPMVEKDRLVRTGELPGSPPATSDPDVLDRYAAGYLAAKQWPNAYPAIAHGIDMLKTSEKTPVTSLVAGDSPTVQSYATAGMNRALLDSSNAARRPLAAMQQADALRAPMPQPSYNPPYPQR